MSLTIDRLKDKDEIIVLYNSVNDDIVRIYDIKGIKDYIGKDKVLKDYFSDSEIENFKEEFDLDEVL